MVAVGGHRRRYNWRYSLSMTSLEQIIREEISSSGPMRFDRFMDLALYHPGLGYYAKAGGASPIGRSGDFYTSVSVGPLFGRLLARQFFQMWQLLGSPDKFHIAEQGAHDGQLACDILEWCRAETPAFFETIHYAIVQASGPARIRQESAPEADIVSRINWFEDLRALAAEKPVGVFFSNELVDAFPVRAITYRAGQWREHCVKVEDSQLAWTDVLLDDPVLMKALAELRPPLVEGYASEINLQASTWMRDVARAIHRGYILTIDYGFPAHEYYAPHRATGTLTAYVKHHGVDDVLADPGMRDITAHVNFTALAKAGKDEGFAVLGLVDQQHFLMGIAHDELSGAPSPRTGIAQNVRAWNTLTHPEHLGLTFHALVQAKDAPLELDGLRYARKQERWDG
jgi:SAM-dependent MidA family methyltransferase